MNTILNVEEPKKTGLWWYLRTYLISLAGILGLGFLLAISLVVSAGLAVLSSRTGSAAAIGEAINFAASTAILTALFAMLFNGFPDTEIVWNDVLPVLWRPPCYSTSASSRLAGTSAPRDLNRPTVRPPPS
jgi:membrane protein